MAAKSTGPLALATMTRRAQMYVSGNSFSRSRGESVTRPDAYVYVYSLDSRDSFHPVSRDMERSHKSSKSTSKNSGSKRSSSSREPSEKVHAQATLNALINIHRSRHIRNLRNQVNAKPQRRLPIVTTMHNTWKKHNSLLSRL